MASKQKDEQDKVLEKTTNPKTLKLIDTINFTWEEAICKLLKNIESTFGHSKSYFS